MVEYMAILNLDSDPRVDVCESIPEMDVNITALIHTMVSRYIDDNVFLHRARDINGGLCYDFANELQAVAGGTLIRTSSKLEFACHGWLYWNGKHYDSESPDGVVNWLHLNIFKRHRKLGKRFDKL